MNIDRNEEIIPKGKVQCILRNVITGKEEIFYNDNLVTTAAKSSLADALRGTETNTTGEITYCALGTSAVAPALSDIKLGTEIFRKLISVRSVAANVATFETFFTIAEGNGSLREAGLFGDGATGTTDSGTLFCHVAISRTKTSNDTLTLRWNVTFL